MCVCGASTCKGDLASLGGHSPWTNHFQHLAERSWVAAVARVVAGRCPLGLSKGERKRREPRSARGARAASGLRSSSYNFEKVRFSQKSGDAGSFT